MEPMTDDRPGDPTGRPPQVTVAGWAAAIGSAVVLLAVWEAIGNLQSVDMRDQITSFLAAGSGHRLGVDVAEVTRIIRVCLYVGALAAVVTGVLGPYVLVKDRIARVVLSCAAIPVVVTAPFASTYPGLIVGFAAALLWTEPARAWFEGRPVVLRAPRPLPPVRPEPPRTSAPALPPPTGAPVLLPPPAPRPPVSARPLVLLPRQLRVACILTWVFCAVTGSAALGIAGWALFAGASLKRQVLATGVWDPQMDPGLILPTVVVAALVLACWCFANALFAGFVWQGRKWAWLVLSVSVGVASLFSLLGFPGSVVLTAALAFTLGSLLAPAVRSWFADRPW
jgi:hypothetical protein